MKAAPQGMEGPAWQKEGIQFHHVPMHDFTGQYWLFQFVGKQMFF